MQIKAKTYSSLRFFTRLLTVLGVFIFLLIGFALLALNFWLPSHIDRYRPEIESWLSARINATASISSLEAHRNGLIPSIYISNLHITDSDKQQALHIKRISASLSLKSLFLLRPEFTDLHIQNPDILIQLQTNGSLKIAGIAIHPPQKHETHHATTETNKRIPASVLWLLKQPGITISNGRIRWQNQQNNTVFELQRLDASLLSSAVNSHNIQITATPPPEIAERITVQASLTEPRLAPNSDFKNWQADIDITLPSLDLQKLHTLLPSSVKGMEGQAAAKAYFRYSEGQLTDSYIELASTDLKITPAAELPSILFANFHSRIDTSWQDNALTFHTKNLSFSYTILTNDGPPPELAWENKEASVTFNFDNKMQFSGGSAKLTNIDLHALSSLASAFPLPQPAQESLASMAVKGTLEYLDIWWQGPMETMNLYAAKGALTNLSITAGEAPPIPEGKKIRLGRPGTRNLNISFDLTERGGDVQLTMKNGSIELPGLYDQPLLAITNLQAAAHVEHLESGQYKIESPQLQLKTPDFDFESSLSWTSSPPDSESSDAGYFTMDGTFYNGHGIAVPHYLPNSIDPKVRTYLQAALIAGRIPQASVTIRGPLADFPYHHNKTGVFLIKGTVENATYAFAPKIIQPPLQTPWPTLDQITGEIEITGQGIVIRNASGSIMNTPGSHFAVQEVSIPDWGINDTHVLVNADISGPGNTLFKTVNQSPIGQDILKNNLALASISGDISTKLDLDIMLDRMPDTTVKGQVNLNGNTLTLWPFLPELQKASTTVHFTEKGFSTSDIQAHALGGTLQGTASMDLKQGLSIDLKGSFTAKGLFSDKNWGHQLFPELKWLSGRSNYTFKAMHEGGRQVMLWQSDLKGLKIQLPEPMSKQAQTAAPLRVTLTPVKSGANQFLPLLIKVEATSSQELPSFQAHYALTGNKAGAKITQGTIGINRSPVMPMTGTTAYVQLDYLNVPSWFDLLNTLPHTKSAENLNRTSASNPVLPIWWPQTTTTSIGELRIGERFIAHNTQLNIQRQYDDWRAEISSDEIAGHVRWQAGKSSAPNLLSANFSRLWFPSFLDGEEKFLQTSQTQQNAEQHLFTLLPNTQLHIDDLRFGEKQIGTLALDALIDRSVTPHRWRIKELEISNDASTLKAHGYWANTLIPTTSLDIRVDLRDTGKLIRQLGYDRILAAAPGTIAGVLSWQAPPYAFNLDSLSGNLDISMSKGQVLFANPGAGRLLSVLSLQTLPSRLSLDFRDLFGEGLAFDTLKGQLSFKRGSLEVRYINLLGASAQVYVAGDIDLINETQQLQVFIWPLFDVIPVSLALTAINPPVGIGSLLAQLALKGSLQNAGVRLYDVTGSWRNPEVTRNTEALSNIQESEEP